MSLISISDLTFSYEGSSEEVFSDVKLQLDTNWRLGLVGRNGRGKTTLLKLLAGELHGRGSISGGTDFEYFPYAVKEPDILTFDLIRDIAFEAEDWEIYREISLLSMNEGILWQPFSTLSGGEQTKVMLAGLFLRKNAFLLIDEPTNHLDAAGRRQLGEYISRKKGFIMVSHDRKFLDTCTDHTLSINRCGIELIKGNYSEWQRNKDMQDSFEIEKNRKLKKDIKRLETAAKRTSEWSDRAESRKIGFDPSKTEKSLNRRPMEGAKAKKLMARSAAILERRERAVTEKEGLLKNIEQTAALKITPLKFHSDSLVRLDSISVNYGEKQVCGNVSFTVIQGEQTVITGSNGCGKSSILKLICGEDICHGGELEINGGLKISYVPQKTDHLRGMLNDYAEELGIDISLFFTILRKLDFRREMFLQPIESFSAGQKKKVMIAGSLCEKAHLYIWDEPLNFVDIISRTQIEQLILESRPTMLFVEHDEMFCEKIATRTVKI